MIINALELRKKVSEETGCTESEVTDIINCFYNDWLKDLLSEFKYTFVLVEHLGLFNIRHKQYDKLIASIEKDIKKYTFQLSTSTESTHPNLIKIWNSKLEKLHLCLFNINILRENSNEAFKRNVEEKRKRDEKFNQLNNESV